MLAQLLAKFHMQIFPSNQSDYKLLTAKQNVP